MRQIVLNFDGSITRNPDGEVTCSYILSENENVIECGREEMGSGPGFSNNLAEFYGLFFGLNAIRRIVDDIDEPFQIKVFGDSNVVIRVMNGKPKDKSKKAYVNAYKLALNEHQYLTQYGCLISYEWISRNDNIIADAICRDPNLVLEINQGK